MIIRDSISVCRLYSRRIDFKNNFGDQNTNDNKSSISISDTNGSKTRSRAGSRLRKIDGGGSPNKNLRSSIDDQSKSSFPFEDEDELGKMFGSKNNNDFDQISN